MVHLHHTALALRAVVSARGLLGVAEFRFAGSEIFIIDQVLLIWSEVDVNTCGAACTNADLGSPLLSASTRSSNSTIHRGFREPLARRLGISSEICAITRPFSRGITNSLLAFNHISCRFVLIKIIVFSFLHHTALFFLFNPIKLSICLAIRCLRDIVIRITRRFVLLFHVL